MSETTTYKRKKATPEDTVNTETKQGSGADAQLPRQTSWVKDMRYGRSISIEFFRHNAWLIVAMLVAVISLIGLRYKTKTKMREIKTLTAELKRAESAKLQEKAAYMSLIRETEMKRLTTEKGLMLTFQEQPPFEVETVNE